MTEGGSHPVWTTGVGGEAGAVGSWGSAGLDGSQHERQGGTDASVEDSEGGISAAIEMCPPAEAPILLGVAGHPEAENNELRSFDLTTGTDRSYPDPGTPKPLGTLSGVYGSGITVDKGAHRLYIVGSSSDNPGYEHEPAPTRIFTIDTSSGEVLGRPPLGGDLLFQAMTVDRGGALLGLFSGGGDLSFRSIDPSTGAVQPYRDIAGLEWVGWHATDPIGRRWYLVGGTLSVSENDHHPVRLFTIDMATGTVLASPAVRWPGIDSRSLVVDRGHRLLALYSNGGIEEVRSIDPMTGFDSAFPDPGTTNVVAGLETIIGVGAIDTDVERMYLPGIIANDPTPRLFSIDLTGATPARSSLLAGNPLWVFFACR